MRQKGLDVLMAQDMIELGRDCYFDKAVIVSGDADFVEPLKNLKRLHKRVEVWSFRNSIPRELKKAAGTENVHYMDSILNEVKFTEQR